MGESKLYGPKEFDAMQNIYAYILQLVTLN